MPNGVSQAEQASPKPVKGLRIAAGAIALGLGLSGVVAGVATVVHAAWFAVAFEGMIALAGAFGVIWSLRKPRTDSALAILFVAGTIFVASVLSWLGAGRILAGVSLTPVLAGRLIACAALAAVAAAIHVADKPAWAGRRIGLGLILVGLPTAALAGLWLAPSVRAALTSLHPALATAGGALLFVSVVGMLSAGAHLLITAFDPTRAPSGRASADPPA